MLEKNKKIQKKKAHKQKQKKNKKINNNEIDIFNNIPNMLDLILPDELQEKRDYLILGYNKFTRIFVMTIFPEDTWIGWLDNLFKLGNINISVKVEPAPARTIVNQLSKKYAQSSAEYQTYERQGNILHLPELETQLHDLKYLRKLIQTNNDKLYFATIFVSLNAENLEELNEKTKLIENEFIKKGTMIRTLAFRQVEGLKTLLPVGEVPISNYERNMITGGIATLIPISNPNLSHNTGIFIGRNAFTNAPVYIDTFIGPPQLPNPHVFICGTSGGGKSVALKLLAARNIATTGCGAFFIDIEGEYTNLTKMLGGKVIKIVQGESAGLNPFDLEQDYKGNRPYLNIDDKVAEIRALISTICRNKQAREIDAEEYAEIEIVVKQLYAEKRNYDRCKFTFS
ncbi:MAG: DUF853 family protein [Clostridia bacterium]|nr:DUF853 family protein [Clostridia bacterium]MBP3800950.1 DUF853 family protein [Clostridia bacterium]